MSLTVSESKDGLTLTFKAPILPIDEREAINEIQFFRGRHFANKSRCDCKAGLHEVRASGDRMRPWGPDSDAPLMAVYYCTSPGCKRTACVASQAGYATHCCRSCAETGSHSPTCDSYWPGMAARIIKREVA